MAKQNNKIPVIYTKQIIIEGDNQPDIPSVKLSIKNNELSIKDRNDNSLFSVNKEGNSVFDSLFLSNSTAALRIDGQNNETTLIRTGLNALNNVGSFGFSLKYMGNRSGNSNSFSIFSDNQDSSTQIEAFTILQNGYTGILNSNPGTPLDVGGNGVIRGDLYTGTNTDSNGSTWLVRKRFDTDTGLYSGGSDSISLVTGNDFRIYVTSAGDVGIGTNLTTPAHKLEVNGNIGFTSNGQGISFGNSTGGSSTGALLNDYEEGTWTPRVYGNTTAGDGTYATNGQIGRYTKIGDRVFIQMYVNVTDHTGTGNMLIDGLPFTPNGGTNTYSSLAARPQTLLLPSGMTYLGAFIWDNTDDIYLHGCTQAGTANQAVQIDQFSKDPSGFTLMLEGSYIST